MAVGKIDDPVDYIKKLPRTGQCETEFIVRSGVFCGN